MKRAQKKLSDQDVAKILGEAKKESFFDYVALKTLLALDLRRAELVGQNDTNWHWAKGYDRNGEEWYHESRSHPNPGMLIEKLTDKGIWLRRKKHDEDTFCPIPQGLMVEIRQLIGKRSSGPIFPRTTGWVWYRVQHYSKKAGIQDWKLIHPHSIRHYATTQTGRRFGVVRARDHAGHANIATTNRYLAESEPEEIEEASQSLMDAIEGS